ncbi:MAG: rod shape-determining protein MreD [Planctomycetaceae bacterium]
MKTILWLIAAYAAFVSQAALVPRLPWGDFAPDLLLVVACCAVFANAGWRGIAWAAAIGLLGDCLAAGPLGIRMGALTLIAAVVAMWRDTGPRRSPIGLLAASYPSLIAVLTIETAVGAWFVEKGIDLRAIVEFAAARAAGSFCVLIAVVACGAIVHRASRLSPWEPRGHSPRW